LLPSKVSRRKEKSNNIYIYKYKYI
jgi:hypothetical protein